MSLSHNPRLHAIWFRLFPFRSPLLRESLLLSTPRGTQMFQFPRFPPLALCVHTRVTPHDGCGVPPFGHPRIEARSAAPRGFSQPPTSFIGIRRQGIHRWLFIAWKNTSLHTKDARARYRILKERPNANHPPPTRQGGATTTRGHHPTPIDPHTRGTRTRARSLKTEQRRTGRPALTTVKLESLRTVGVAGRSSSE